MGLEEEIKSLRKKLESVEHEVVFTNHARLQIRSRPTTETEVIKFLKKGGESLNYVELQEDEVYRVNYDISKKHDLVVVFKILKAKLLIITAYRTSRKWQKLVLKRNP